MMWRVFSEHKTPLHALYFSSYLSAQPMGKIKIDPDEFNKQFLEATRYQFTPLRDLFKMFKVCVDKIFFGKFFGKRLLMTETLIILSSFYMEVLAAEERKILGWAVDTCCRGLPSVLFSECGPFTTAYQLAE